jgi:hypothetical protein
VDVRGQAAAQLRQESTPVDSLVKVKRTRPAKTIQFRPGTTGECESQLWQFTGPPEICDDDNTPRVNWVAAESLDAALRYMRRHNDDFTVSRGRDAG